MSIPILIFQNIYITEGIFVVNVFSLVSSFFLQFLVILTPFHMIYKCVIFYYFHLSTSEMLYSKKKKKRKKWNVWSFTPGFKFCLSSEHHEEKEREKSNRTNSVITCNQHVVLNSELKVRSSLVVHHLGLGTSNYCGLGLVTGWGTKILQATYRGKKRELQM